jgi:hypothetical protein
MSSAVAEDSNGAAMSGAVERVSQCAKKEFFCRLTPELSRPVAGRRTRASVAQARGRRHDAGSA